MKTNILQCSFCAHKCRICAGKAGRCGIRKNNGIKIVTINYSELVSIAVDPVEKKPLYHFFPGAEVLSIALAGCNFSCKFCQNYHISQSEHFRGLHHDSWSPEEVIAKSDELDFPLIAYTYSEPTVWRDYMLDTARLARADGGKNIMVTNGFFSDETLELTLEFIDAFNIDLKGGDEFYRRYCGGYLDPVKNSIQRIAASESHLEVTTLLIEKVHAVDEIMRLAEFLEKSGVKVWHISRFYPCFKMSNHPATSEEFMLSIIDKIVSNFDIPHIYVGNSNSGRFSDTLCSDCGELLVRRQDWSIKNVGILDGKCHKCGEDLYGSFQF